jgi:metal-sulfur cluster biosynthetic enzyme
LTNQIRIWVCSRLRAEGVFQQQQLSAGLPGRLRQLKIAFLRCANNWRGRHGRRSEERFVDTEILKALKEVIDPEIGINVVDLGLVGRADRSAETIDVSLMMTSPTCPLGELMVENAKAALSRSFPQTPSIRVALARDLTWTPDRMTVEARRQLGMG